MDTETRTVTNGHATNGAQRPAAVLEQPALQVDAPAGRPLEAVTADPPRSYKPWLIVGAIAAVVLIGVGAFWLRGRGKESTDDAQIEADVAPIAARVSGSVLKVLVNEDQAVKKGDVLIQLDDADWSAKVAAAQAEVATAQAQLEAAQAQASVAAAGARGGFSSAQAAVSGSSASVASAQAQLESARASLAHAEASAHKAHIDLDRAKQLRAGNVVPQATLDAAQATNDEAQASLLQARAQVTSAEQAGYLARSRVGEARGSLAKSASVAPQIAAAEATARLASARLDSAKASLQLAQLQLGYTKIVAPEDGVVSRLTARTGQLLAPGQPVAQLVPHHLYVVANFKETQIGAMRPGQLAEVEVDTYPGKPLEAKVETIAGGTGSRFALLPPDNATGNFVKVVQRVPVRLVFTHELPKDLPLRAGMSSDVTVRVGN